MEFGYTLYYIIPLFAKFLINDTIDLMLLLNSKNIIALGIIAFLTMIFFSLSSMSMDMNGKMINCPFMNSSSSFCQMSVSEHISQWQQFFSITREKSLLLSLFSLLMFLYVAVFFVTAKRYEELKHQRFRGHFYRYAPEIKLFDYLALAFSDGLIRSKIYV